MEGAAKEKNRITGVKKIWDYCKSHMWCSFAAAILIAIILLMFIMWVYMKEQYYTHFVETTYTTEKALLNSVSINMENQMEAYINTGSGISVNEEILNNIQSLDEQGTDGYSIRNISDTLTSVARSSNSIAGIAIASEDGVIYQYDKNQIKVMGSKNLWGDETQDMVKETFAEIKESNGNNEIPRYRILTYPTIHPNIKSMRLIHIAFPLKNVYTYQNMEYIMLVSFDTQALSSFLDQMNQGQEEYIQAYIEDENGEIILHTSGTEYIGMSSEEYLNEHGLTDLTAGIESYGWTLHTVINENILRGEVDAMYGRMVILYLIAIVLILLILFWVTNRILRPVNIISNSIKRVEDGETREQIALEGTNEVWQLAREYNLMLQKIRKASQKVEEQHIQVILRFPFC